MKIKLACACQDRFQRSSRPIEDTTGVVKPARPAVSKPSAPSGLNMRLQINVCHPYPAAICCISLLSAGKPLASQGSVGTQNPEGHYIIVGLSTSWASGRRSCNKGANPKPRRQHAGCASAQQHLYSNTGVAGSIWWPCAALAQ